MTRSTTAFQPDDPAALRELFAAVCNETATPDQFEIFEETLRQDTEAMDSFARFMQMHVLLQRKFAPIRPVVHKHRFDPHIIHSAAAAPTAIDQPIAPIFVGDTAAGTVGYSSSGWPVAYLVATVVVGIGLIVGALVHVSQPVKYVGPDNDVCTPNPQSPIPNPSLVVGRITAMLDCRWTDDATAAIHGAYVPLGRKFALSSGLLEITYDTGARVILQGPVTYEVESAAGGYLSIGKLTAKLEKRSVVSGQRSETPTPQSLIPNPSLSTTRYPLFTITTPTATVTDLGTEFGVEVCDAGTSVHTFRGLVEVHLTQNGDRSEQRIRLRERESVRIPKPQGNAAVKIIRDTVDPNIFVRAEQLPTLARERILKPLRRWRTYSEQLRQDPALVAYYTFEAPEDAPAVLRNLSSAGAALDGHIVGAEWVSGRMPGKWALYFHGPASGDKVVLPDQDRFNFMGPFSVAVWFKVAAFTGEHQGLVTKGNLSWRLQQRDATGTLGFFTNVAGQDDGIIARANGEAEIANRRWHFVVGVYEPAASVMHLRLYVDGRLDTETESPGRVRGTDHPVSLGANSGRPGLEFQGWIDEVAIMARALSAEEAATIFNAGNPAEAIRSESQSKADVQPKAE
jgi:hypothetical protein